MTIARKTTLIALIGAMAASATFAFAQTDSGETTPDEAPMAAPDNAGEGDDMERPRRRGKGMMGRADTDDSGDISPEEFGRRGIGRIVGADADGDGILSMEEITTEMEERRQERREARLLRRYDIDGDGEVTVDEIQGHQQKRFALMDRDDDGVLSAEELRRDRRGMRGHRGGHRMHHGDGHMGDGHHRR